MSTVAGELYNTIMWCSTRGVKNISVYDLIIDFALGRLLVFGKDYPLYKSYLATSQPTCIMQSAFILITPGVEFVSPLLSQ